MQSEVKSRLIEFLAHLGIGQKAFAESVGLSAGFVNSIRVSIQPKTISLISDRYPELNTAWLLTGQGKMLKEDRNETAMISDDSVIMVPIVHIDSVGGMHSPNAIVGEAQYIEGYAPFVDARDGDICIIQSGDSMVPTCPSGSLLLLRQVDNWKEYFGYGDIFVLELVDGRRITKEVTRYDEDPKNYIWCVSHNPDVPDEELPKTMIRSVWKVIKIQINKGW